MTRKESRILMSWWGKKQAKTRIKRKMKMKMGKIGSLHETVIY